LSKGNSIENCSLESHLLVADENINGYNIRGAISQLKMVNQLLRANEQGMLMIIGKLFH
jgi:hypothetical protein